MRGEADGIVENGSWKKKKKDEESLMRWREGGADEGNEGMGMGKDEESWIRRTKGKG